jgi:hypothetical protein
MSARLLRLQAKIPAGRTKRRLVGGPPVPPRATQHETQSLSGVVHLGFTTTESSECIRQGLLTCSLEDFNNASWPDRVHWIESVQDNNKWIAGWLNVFKGTLQYFDGSALSNSDYVKAADAAVLWSVMRGISSIVNHTTTQPGTPAAKWGDFFRSLKGGDVAEETLRGKWGTAEQAGVNWSLSYAKQRGLSIHDSFQKTLFTSFLKIGNEYRAAVRQSKAPGGWLGRYTWGVADPRHDARKVRAAADELQASLAVSCSRMGIGGIIVGQC